MMLLAALTAVVAAFGNGAMAQGTRPQYGKTEKAGGGKLRKIVSSRICSERLEVAFMELMKVDPDIKTPSDVTDLCYFRPPKEPAEYNLGCPFVYSPTFGFPEGEEYVEYLGGNGTTLESLAQYCECYQGIELGCAMKIPHGPPSSRVVYPDVMKSVVVNGYSEYIPYSTPAVRVEYCMMVGVWNGDFDSNIVDDFAPYVADCGCYFISQAREMVDQCPGVDLGSFYVGSNNTTAPTPVSRLLLGQPDITPSRNGY